MSDEPSQEEKTEEPTPKRQKEYRERGEVAKSQEFASAFMLAGAAGSVLLIVIQGHKHIWSIAQAILGHLDEGERFIEDPALLSQVPIAALKTIGPPLLLLCVVAIFGTLIQIGPLFTMKALEPKFSKLNPLPGLKRIFFSKDAVASLLTTLSKVLVLGAVAAFTLYLMVGNATALVAHSPEDLAGYLAKVASYPLITGAATMLILGFAHFLWQRHRMHERMKMTKEEAKREHKETEGDPLMKGRHKQRHRELIGLNKMIDSVQQASVVITNPTHFAVAIRYSPKDGVPIVLAKGADHIAFRIRKMAREHGVPIIENPPLARALHKAVEPGKIIPEEFFRAVAEVLAFVMRAKAMQQTQGKAKR